MKALKALKALSKIALVAVVGAALFAASDVKAQSGQTTPTSTTDYTQILLPFSTLAGNLGISNIYSGWAVLTTNTSITSAWDKTNLVIVNTTNTVITTNTVKAKFSAKGKSKVVVQNEFTESNTSGLGTNFWFAVAKSISDVNYDTNNLTYCTNSYKGNGNSVTCFTLDMTGFNYGQVVLFKWDTVTAGDTLTNTFNAAGNKQTPNN